MISVPLPQRLIASALDLIIQISRLRDGTRRITRVSEVNGLEGDIITLTDLFEFDMAAGVDEEGRFRGMLKANGLRPQFGERLEDQGITFPSDLFIGPGVATEDFDAAVLGGWPSNDRVEANW